jgi:hypothetical protein
MSATILTHQREQDYVLQRSEKFSPLHFLCKIEQIRDGVKPHAGIRLRQVNLRKSSVLRIPQKVRGRGADRGLAYKAPTNGLPRGYAPEQTFNGAGQKSASRTSFENGSGAKGTVGATANRPEPAGLVRSDRFIVKFSLGLTLTSHGQTHAGYTPLSTRPYQ